MFQRFTLTVIALLCLAVPHSSGASIAEKLPLQPIFQAKQTIAIPVTLQGSQAALEFPAVQTQPGKVLCLRFRANLQMDIPGGWNKYLQIRLNGTPLKGMTGNGYQRLLNRSNALANTDSGTETWWGGEGNQSLLVFFGPDGGALDKRAKSDRDEGYWYALDISDAANAVIMGPDNRVESAVPNKLEFLNTYRALPSGETAACHEMHVSDVEVGYVATETLDKLRPASVKAPAALKGKTLRAGGSLLTITRAGALEVKAGSSRYCISSGFSYPGDTAIAFHNFTWDKQDWKPVLTKDKRTGTVTVSGECPTFRIVRTVRVNGGRFVVEDTVQNKTAEPLGMAIRHRVIPAKRFSPGQVTISGNADITSSDACAANPTLFMKQGTGSVGIVAEDNVLRLQLAVINQGDSVQFGSEHFGLQAKARYTTQWTIYPSTTADYWAFINRVRKNWGVNITVPGPFAFGGDEYVPERKVSLYAVAPWLEYASGSGYTEDEFKAILQPKLQKIYAAQPDAVTLGMVETNLVAIEREKLAGSEILPPSSRATRDAYGYVCTPEQTKVFQKVPWFDSMLKMEDGCVRIDLFYPSKPYVDMMVYPAVGNYHLKYMLGQIDFLMDKVGFRGIYLDQFTWAIRGQEQRDRADYSKWDGHTVALDGQGRIARKYTDCNLAGATARAKIIKHVCDKGGTLVVNGHSVVRETTGLRCFSFHESEWTDWDVVAHLRDEPPFQGDMVAGHLDTPICLGIRPSRFEEAGKQHFAEIMHKWVIACLKNGQLYYYYESTIPKEGPGAGEYGELNHMYPFTPVELHPGWLVGKERTITAKSGTFTWSHPGKPVVRLFDLKGHQIPAEAKMRQQGKQWQVTLKMDDWNEVAVIEAK